MAQPALHVAASAFTGGAERPRTSPEAERTLELGVDGLELGVDALEPAAIRVVLGLVALAGELGQARAVVIPCGVIQRRPRIAAIRPARRCPELERMQRPSWLGQQAREHLHAA